MHSLPPHSPMMLKWPHASPKLGRHHAARRSGARAVHASGAASQRQRLVFLGTPDVRTSPACVGVILCVSRPHLLCCQTS